MYKKFFSIFLFVVIFLIGNFAGYSIALAGTLTSTNVQPASLVAGTTNQVTVNFSTIGVIPPGGKVKVTFGAGFNVAGANGGTCSSFLDDTGFTTTVASQVVTIARWAGTATVAAHAETCTINGIVNPVSAGSTGTYTITTTDPSDVLIDNDVAVTADVITNPANITIASAKITSSNTVLVTLVNPSANIISVDFTRWHIDQNNSGEAILNPSSASITSAGAPWTITLTFTGTPFSNSASSYGAAHGLYVDALGVTDTAGDTNVIVLYSDDSISITDGQAPTVISATTKDTNLNGKIDNLTVIYSEAINDADRNAVAVVGYTINALDDSSFDYTSGTYCQSGTNPTPTTVLPGGIFSSTPAGLSINPTTGTINLATSALGTYTLSYLTNGINPNTRSITTTITNITPSASFSYGGSPFAQNGVNPFPVFSPGASAGIFTAPSGLVFVNVNTGEINLSASTPGTYLVTNTIPVSGSCGGAVDTTTVTITGSSNISVEYPLVESESFDTGVTPALTWIGANATDLAGNILDITGASANATDGAKPILVSFTSTTPNGTYGPGSSVNITATYSENIASGSVIVDLNNHPTTLITLYTISTNTFSGDYVVGATGSGQDVTGLDVLTITSNSAADSIPLTDTDTTLPLTTLITGSSINIDTTAPINENTVFPTSVSTQGGIAVIVTTSDVGTNRWFAPSGTITFVAGATMTEASCDGCTTITAPATEGAYKLFVVDAVGNISNESTATLTVDNTPSSTPVATPVADTYTSSQGVTLSSAGSTSIRYTIDGTDPSTCSSGLLYSGSINVSSSLIIKARGCDNANNTSSLGTFIYTINIFSGVISSGGVRNSGLVLVPISVTLTEVFGCKNRTTGFSTVTGQSCVTNISHNEQAPNVELFHFTLLLKVGSRGNEVIELQKFLNGVLYKNELVVDGKFGLKTKMAVIKFQLVNVLEGDGIVGPLTRVILNK